MTRDDAVIGEAAGLAMGLVMIGTRNHMAIDDMVNVRVYVSLCNYPCNRASERIVHSFSSYGPFSL